MVKFLVIFVLSILCISSKIITKCPTIPFKEDKCFESYESSNTLNESKDIINLYQKCENDKICLINSNIGVCIPKPKKNLNEECNSNLDCKSNICSSFKCIWKKLKETCKNTNECSFNLYCYKNKCERLNDLNEECDSNSFGVK